MIHLQDGGIFGEEEKEGGFAPGGTMDSGGDTPSITGATPPPKWRDV
jgi:hypothetical protein